MKTLLLKNLGIILILIGVIILVTYYAMGSIGNNKILCLAMIFIIAGVILYIILNKKFTN